MPLPLVGAVGAPSSTSAPDGANLPLLQGKQGDAVVTELHGKWYTQNYRGRLYFASTAAAGITIPASSATAATFVLYNPIGSGINMELVSLVVGQANATMVVNTIGLGVIKNLVVAPTANTALTVQNGITAGGGTGLGQAFSVSTLAAAATLFYWMFNVGATTGALPNYEHQFDGRLILGPGSLVHLVGSVAVQTNATPVTAAWIEAPV